MRTLHGGPLVQAPADPAERRERLSSFPLPFHACNQASQRPERLLGDENSRRRWPRAASVLVRRSRSGMGGGGEQCSTSGSAWRVPRARLEPLRLKNPPHLLGAGDGVESAAEEAGTSTRVPEQEIDSCAGAACCSCGEPRVLRLAEVCYTCSAQD